MKLIDISTKKYPNMFTMVDDEDFEWLNQWKWYRNEKGYVKKMARIDGKQRELRMHRVILAAKKGESVDHINGDGLDNRRENLRKCAVNQNNYNKKAYGDTSRFKGVYYDKNLKSFVARIKIHGKRRLIGRFKVENEAAAAYNEKAKELFGEFAWLNRV